jgi:predicted RNA-binding protein (virulence factor B family)
MPSTNTWKFSQINSIQIKEARDQSYFLQQIKKARDQSIFLHQIKKAKDQSHFFY